MKSMIARSLLVPVILLSVCLVTPASADPCGEYPMLEESRLGFTPASYLHGMYTRVGDVVYASGHFSDFQVYDVSHPTQPALLANVDAAFSTHLGDLQRLILG